MHLRHRRVGQGAHAVQRVHRRFVEVPVEHRRLEDAALLDVHQVLVELADDRGQWAALADEPLRLADRRVETAIEPDHAAGAGALCGLQQAAGLRDVQPRGLLQQGGDAGLQADLRHRGVELRRHRDDHGVRRFGLEHLLRRRVGGRAAELLGRHAAALGVRVAHRRHGGSVDRGDVAGVAAAASSASDQGYAQLFHASDSSTPATSIITLRSCRSPRASAVIISGTSSSVQRASMKVASRSASSGRASTLSWKEGRSNP